MCSFDCSTCVGLQALQLNTAAEYHVQHYSATCSLFVCASVCSFVHLYVQLLCSHAQFMFLRSFSVLFLCRCALSPWCRPPRTGLRNLARVTPTQGSRRVMTASGQQLVNARLSKCINRFLNVKAVVATINKEKALVGAFPVIVQYSGTFR